MLAQFVGRGLGPSKVRVSVAQEVANKCCVGIPKGTILHSYDGGDDDTLSVILNRPTPSTAKGAGA